MFKNIVSSFCLVVFILAMPTSAEAQVTIDWSAYGGGDTEAEAIADAENNFSQSAMALPGYLSHEIVSTIPFFWRCPLGPGGVWSAQSTGTVTLSDDGYEVFLWLLYFLGPPPW